MRLNTLGKRIGFSFASILVALSVVIASTLWQVQEISDTSEYISSVRTPTSTLSLKMLNGVNQTLASLRGWMLLGQEDFRAERQSAWNKINTYLKELEILSSKWANEEDVKRIGSLKKELADLRLQQDEIEQIAQSEKNIPALGVFFNQAMPQVEIMLREISAMMDSELYQAANQERKLLLGMMGRFHASLGLGLAELRAYLTTGNEEYIERFYTQWGTNKRAFRELQSQQKLFTPEQEQAFAFIGTARIAFAQLPQKLYELRAAEKWNIANFQLESLVRPKALQIINLLDNLISSQQFAMHSDFSINHKQIENLHYLEWILLLIGSFVCLVSGIFTTRSVVKPLRKTITIIDDIAAGDFDTVVDIKGADEVQQLGHAVDEMTKTLKAVAETSNAMAKGNFSHSIQIKSERDQLGKSLKSMMKNSQDMVLQMEQIAQGDYSVVIKLRDKNDSLSLTIMNMLKNLKHFHEESRLDNWIKTGQSKLAEHIRGGLTISTLSKNMLKFLAGYLDAQVGLLYVNDGHEALTLTASYAHKDRSNVPDKLKFGEGLIGQCAVEQQVFILEDVPDDYVQIHSGLGRVNPKCIMVIPVIVDEKVQAIIELGFINEIEANVESFIELVSEAIGMALVAARNREQMHRLLSETQQQAHDLEKQQGELKTANSELESRAETLAESQDKMKSQSDQLRVAYDELHDKSAALDQQRQDAEAKSRDIEVARSELEVKAKELETASKYKSEFLANMSHDLRTPLNSLLILSDLLIENNEDNLTADQLQSLNVIRNGGKSLLSLINDILDLSKVEAGKLTIEFAEEPLTEIIGSLKELFNPIAQDKGIDFEIEVPDNAPTHITTDGQRIAQILKNLLSNAMKFTKKGVVKLSVSQPSDDQIRFSIQDTGCGIAKNKQDLIFGAFCQEDGSTSRQYGGTGLGLAISRELAEKLGGEIALASEAGQGSTFSLTLPLQASPELEQEQSAEKTSPIQNNIEKTESPAETPLCKVKQEQLKQVCENKTVLIADDDMRNTFAISKVLNQHGFTVLMAENGEEAVNKLEQEKAVDLVLMDIMMPTMDGYEAMKIIRQQSCYADLPIIALTANAMLEERSKCIDAGATEYLTKPINLEMLNNLIYECMRE